MIRQSLQMLHGRRQDSGNARVSALELDRERGAGWNLATDKQAHPPRRNIVDGRSARLKARSNDKSNQEPSMAIVAAGVPPIERGPFKLSIFRQVSFLVTHGMIFLFRAAHH